MVKGQIAGGFAQGLGGALMEEFTYNESGDPLAVTFADYLMPTVRETPDLEIILREDYPTPLNPLGIKGAGESGVNAVGAAIASAIDDAIGIPGRDHAASGDAAAAEGDHRREAMMRTARCDGIAVAPGRTSAYRGGAALPVAGPEVRMAARRSGRPRRPCRSRIALGAGRARHRYLAPACPTAPAGPTGPPVRLRPLVLEVPRVRAGLAGPEVPAGLVGLRSNRRG